MPCAGWGEPASIRPFRLLPSRSILPALLSGEQLVSRHAGRPLPVRVPLCLAALLAVCVSRGPRPGEPPPLALPEGVRDPIPSGPPSGDSPYRQLLLETLSSASVSRSMHAVKK